MGLVFSYCVVKRSFYLGFSQEKRVGYLGLTQLLDENTEVLMCLGGQKTDLFTFLYRLGKLYCHDTIPEKLEVTGVARVTGVGIFDSSRAVLCTEL